MGDEAYDVYFRDLIECLKALFSDPEFARYLVFLPERHYADPDKTMRLFYDMHTGKWWWEVQVSPSVLLIAIRFKADLMFSL